MCYALICITSKTDPHCRYHAALEDQPRLQLLPEKYATTFPVALIGIGQLFVLTSTWALGVTGTFLGDYFGILMDHRVEGYVLSLCFPCKFYIDIPIDSPSMFCATQCMLVAPCALLVVPCGMLFYVCIDRTFADVLLTGPNAQLDFLSRRSSTSFT